MLTGPRSWRVGLGCRGDLRRASIMSYIAHRACGLCLLAPISSRHRTGVPNRSGRHAASTGKPPRSAWDKRGRVAVSGGTCVSPRRDAGRRGCGTTISGVRQRTGGLAPIARGLSRSGNQCTRSGFRRGVDDRPRGGPPNRALPCGHAADSLRRVRWADDQNRVALLWLTPALLFITGLTPRRPARSKPSQTVSKEWKSFR